MPFNYVHQCVTEQHQNVELVMQEPPTAPLHDFNFYVVRYEFGNFDPVRLSSFGSDL
jgi:hypothetical protein